ncbi:LacI family DNA-binding transcriptional regulator [Novosphingobium sp. Leaf2]|uniref:LacI family DNA-binding transcriptional regulator n=1 Tax=Novosphingobium sp. Leaf2 TaxID=1735670 RepID=UPI000700B14F|nr:LacI family DNA-binding transcriptional regulator [Novosphingobium sp. Leaf2]KQM21583.1 LacI family transcriptional regulator [Novosphingobium sp. Leaf2]
MAVGIKDVAKVAGVSPATVSRVLSGRVVDAAMHERVMAAVQSTGYRPNLAARRLRSRHSNTIGLIVADIRNPFFTAVSRVIEDVAYARGLRVILCNTDEDPEREAMYLQLMQEERVTGVILAPSRDGADSVGRFSADFPVVLIDRAVPGVTRDCVVLDNEAMAGALVEHLHAAGHRRITGLFGASSATGVQRRSGFEHTAARLGMDAQALSVPHGAGETHKAVATIMAGAGRPTALVASNGVRLMGVLRALQELGVSVPGDVALAGFDNEDWMEFVGGGLTVVEQPVEEIGRAAMTMLFERLERPDAAARRMVLAGRLVARGSSAYIQETIA